MIVTAIGMSTEIAEIAASLKGIEGSRIRRHICPCEDGNVSKTAYFRASYKSLVT